ncbi:hypothetical protein C8F04DRAFT_1150110 [Mycena alexandri]|uniref:Uncharacterized protein n=1 Tax=Mycena alexandri TaxID=1745969 RepID=A0AAD6RYN7_9AGAR|nr:hypothetical protein C8F04DRAFT_1155962 [Mycena alexandri]KAJ7018778.1 hypothetical protein C8F04DRAFT_1150110 [Mycena alexandri]
MCSVPYFPFCSMPAPVLLCCPPRLIAVPVCGLATHIQTVVLYCTVGTHQCRGPPSSSVVLHSGLSPASTDEECSPGWVTM